MNPIEPTNQPHIPLFVIQQEIRLHERFLKIISTPMPDEIRREQLSALLRERASLLEHVPVNGLKERVIFFNMKQIGLAPTPICQAYNKMRVATISNYHTIGSSVGIVQLDASAMQDIPKEVMKMAGDLTGKEVEFFWTAIDGRPFAAEHSNTKINLVTHPWTHPFAHVKDNVYPDVNMGIFPEIGFTNHSGKGAIAFHSLSPMQVHAHLSGTGANKSNPKADDMLFSPNNAHFEVISGSPFGIFWSVARKDNRVAFTKALVIFDYNHPICQGLVGSLRNCDNLEIHLKRLEGFAPEIYKTLDLPAHQFMDAFHKLPPAFQYGIYKEAWILFGSKRGIHGDFGYASFENHFSLDPQYHCNAEQRRQAVHNFADRLCDLLVCSQTNLMLNAQPLQKGSNVLKMMRCAELFEGANEIRSTRVWSKSIDRNVKLSEDQAETARIERYQQENVTKALELFHTFSPAEKEAVFFAIWELSRCPRTSNFGTETFFSKETSFSLKSQALLLAASRQTPEYDAIPEAPIETVVQEVPPPAPVVIKAPVVESEVPQIPLEEAELPISTIGAPIFNPVTITSPPSQEITSQQVLENLTNLAFDGNFRNLNAEERKPLIMAQFNYLPTSVKNTIYGKVYEYSTDPWKGGDEWGKHHVADSLDVLIDALQDVLGSN